MKTVDFIGTVVAKMNPSIEIESTVNNGDGTFTITIAKDNFTKLCKTYWIRVGLILTINAIDYEVTAFTQDIDVTLKGTVSPTATFTLNAPFYFHGTPIASNNEWINQRKEEEKYPLIYLIEPLNEEFQDELSGIEKISSLNLLFLDITFQKKNTVDNYVSSINPLEEMVDLFVDLFKEEGLVLSFSHGQKNHVKIGVETSNKGHTKKILNDPLNGIEMSSSISFLSSTECIICN